MDASTTAAVGSALLPLVMKILMWLWEYPLYIVSSTATDLANLKAQRKPVRTIARLGFNAVTLGAIWIPLPITYAPNLLTSFQNAYVSLGVASEAWAAVFGGLTIVLLFGGLTSYSTKLLVQLYHYVKSSHKFTNEEWFKVSRLAKELHFKAKIATSLAEVCCQLESCKEEKSNFKDADEITEKIIETIGTIESFKGLSKTTNVADTNTYVKAQQSLQYIIDNKQFFINGKTIEQAISTIKGHLDAIRNLFKTDEYKEKYKVAFKLKSIVKTYLKPPDQQQETLRDIKKNQVRFLSDGNSFVDRFKRLQDSADGKNFLLLEMTGEILVEALDRLHEFNLESKKKIVADDIDGKTSSNPQLVKPTHFATKKAFYQLINEYNPQLYYTILNGVYARDNQFRIVLHDFNEMVAHDTPPALSREETIHPKDTKEIKEHKEAPTTPKRTQTMPADSPINPRKALQMAATASIAARGTLTSPKDKERTAKISKINQSVMKYRKHHQPTSSNFDSGKKPEPEVESKINAETKTANLASPKHHVRLRSEDFNFVTLVSGGKAGQIRQEMQDSINKAAKSRRNSKSNSSSGGTKNKNQVAQVAIDIKPENPPILPMATLKKNNSNATVTLDLTKIEDAKAKTPQTLPESAPISGTVTPPKSP